MTAILAKTSMGICTCGAAIEAGEAYYPRQAGAVHVGCPERQTAVSQSTVTETSGFLFSEMETATIEDAKATLGVSHISFDGPTAMQIDTARLAGQLARVYTLMSDGRFRTLSAIAEAAGCMEQSASARLRDLRKKKFGGHQIIPRRLSVEPLVYEYQLVPNTAKEPDGQRHAA